MKKEEVLILIHKYFEAETSLEDERRLKEYFSRREETAPELEPYADLFRYLHNGQADTTLLQPMIPSQRRISWQAQTAAAAILALLIAIAGWSYFLPKAKKQPTSSVRIDWTKYESTSVEAAYEVTREALIRVAQVVDQSEQNAQIAAERIQNATEMLEFD